MGVVPPALPLSLTPDTTALLSEQRRKASGLDRVQCGLPAGVGIEGTLPQQLLAGAAQRYDLRGRKHGHEMLLHDVPLAAHPVGRLDPSPLPRAQFLGPQYGLQSQQYVPHQLQQPVPPQCILPGTIAAASLPQHSAAAFRGPAQHSPPGRADRSSGGMSDNSPSRPGKSPGRAAGRGDAPPESPSVRDMTQPCNHNDWDDVRTRRHHKILQCRKCQSKWKLRMPVPRCSYFLHGHCASGDSCKFLHVYKKKGEQNQPCGAAAQRVEAEREGADQSAAPPAEAEEPRPDALPTELPVSTFTPASRPQSHPTPLSKRLACEDHLSMPSPFPKVHPSPCSTGPPALMSPSPLTPCTPLPEGLNPVSPLAMYPSTCFPTGVPSPRSPQRRRSRPGHFPTSCLARMRIASPHCRSRSLSGPQETPPRQQIGLSPQTFLMAHCKPRLPHSRGLFPADTPPIDCSLSPGAVLVSPLQRPQLLPSGSQEPAVLLTPETDAAPEPPAAGPEASPLEEPGGDGNEGVHAMTEDELDDHLANFKLPKAKDTVQTDADGAEPQPAPAAGD
eukprot:TRINITY_DN2002_c0_g2_i2.p1 TRINITY_DN2002_c0_g2~~TRINITY_DN2002_c0_g2_i2.p1  ORF type:complete len:559 (+),score=152.35 TRINITY_DN2002_c0_g2_i2:113-1789(+)